VISKILRSAGRDLKTLTLGVLRHDLITILHPSKSPKLLPKNGKNTVKVCDFHD
jgi:hypothetical protein